MDMEIARRPVADARTWKELYQQASVERSEALARARDAEHELAQLERDYRRMKRRLSLAIAAALALANAAFWVTLLA